MAEFASKGVAGAGLGTGIAGLSLGVLNSMGGLLGIHSNANMCCSENTPVTRYELDMENKIVAKDSEIALLKSNIYTDQKLADIYANLQGQINAVKDNQNAINTQQAVYNGTNTATINCIQSQIAQLQGLTKCIIPITNVCPQPMPQYNSWTAPTTTTTPAA